MTDFNKSFWDQFIEPYKPNLEKLFASIAWKKAIVPWMKAHRENRVRTILVSRDPVETDINKGMALAFEMLLNLQNAIEASKKLKPEVSEPTSATTDYSEGMSWDDEERD